MSGAANHYPNNYPDDSSLWSMSFFKKSSWRWSTDNLSLQQKPQLVYHWIFSVTFNRKYFFPFSCWKDLALWLIKCGSNMSPFEVRSEVSCEPHEMRVGNGLVLQRKSIVLWNREKLSSRKTNVLLQYVT